MHVWNSKNYRTHFPMNFFCVETKSSKKSSKLKRKKTYKCENRRILENAQVNKKPH